MLLPVLGAVPDAAIVIASGALGTREEAQSQVAVGVGTLAGSTIMLLTGSRYYNTSSIPQYANTNNLLPLVPWAISMIVARCDIGPDGKAVDERCTSCSTICRLTDKFWPDIS